MRIQGVSHIGIRVCEEQRSVRFYESLGFRAIYRDAADPVLVLKHDGGVELNLIMNARTPFDGKNPLMDVPVKLPGITHVALRVASIEETVAFLGQAGIAITEGPRQLGSGMSLFVRDPDANVIELRQEG